MTAGCYPAGLPLLLVLIVSMVAGMGDLFDATAMYDEDYLYFFAAPGEVSEFASHGPVVPGADLPGEAARARFVAINSHFRWDKEYIA